MDRVFVYENSYQAYLDSPEFDEIRQEVFARDGWKCVACGSMQNLQPHHLTYQNCGHEELRDLITLCSKCHTAFHVVDDKRKEVEEYYNIKSREDYYAEANQRIHDQIAESERREKASKDIENEIKAEYLNKDYAKNGDFNMCDWSVLNKIIEKKCEEHDIKYWNGSKAELMKFFEYYRCLFFVRCMDKGISMDSLLNKTRFDFQYLRKNYNRQRCESKIKEYEELFKEEK